MVFAFLAISSLLPKGSVVASLHSARLLTEFSTKSKAVLLALPPAFTRKFSVSLEQI